MNAKEFRSKLLCEETKQRFLHLKAIVDKATDEGMAEYKEKGYITLGVDDSSDDRTRLISELTRKGLTYSQSIEVLDSAKLQMIDYLKLEGWNYAELGEAPDSIPTVTL